MIPFKKNRLNSLRSAKNNAPTLLGTSEPMAPKLSAIPKGLTIINCSDALDTAEVRNTFDRLATMGSSKLGIPMGPPSKVTSIYPEAGRRMEQAKYLFSANPALKNPKNHAFMAVGSRDRFDWCSPEGLNTLLPLVASATGWLMFEQQVMWPFSPIFATGLTHISNAAKQAGVRVMMFVVCADRCEKTALDQLCEEYIEVTSCEPNPDCRTAFVIDCVNIRHLNSHGLGKTMCSVNLAAGVLYRQFEQFVSHDLSDRVIWILRGQGKTEEEIGTVVGLNKSNVSRRLKGLPPPRKAGVRADWIDRYLEGVLAASDGAAVAP